MNQLTIYVLFVWPRDTDPDTPDAKPEQEIPFVEFGTEDEAWLACTEAAGRYHATKQRTKMQTHRVDSSRPNPVQAALVLARRAIGVTDQHHRGALRLSGGRNLDLARTVAPADAIAHVRNRYGLAVDPTDATWGLVLTRVGRRDQLGDPEAEVALGLLAEEHARAKANADRVPVEKDPLTYANHAHRSNHAVG